MLLAHCSRGRRGWGSRCPPLPPPGLLPSRGCGSMGPSCAPWAPGSAAGDPARAELTEHHAQECLLLWGGASPQGLAGLVTCVTHKAESHSATVGCERSGEASSTSHSPRLLRLEHTLQHLDRSHVLMRTQGLSHTSLSPKFSADTAGVPHSSAAEPHPVARNGRRTVRGQRRKCAEQRERADLHLDDMSCIP